MIINTGRFTEQKNQSFIIDLVSVILNNYEKNIKLLLLGDGPLKETYLSKVNELNMNDHVVFLGVKNNVQDYLFASDCYVMPSLYEGLPVAGIEAECSGIHSVFSSEITKEVKIRDNVDFIDLSDSVKCWCEAVLKSSSGGREKAVEDVRKAGYDISDVAYKMQEFYLGVVN